MTFQAPPSTLAAGRGAVLHVPLDLSQRDLRGRGEVVVAVVVGGWTYGTRCESFFSTDA